VAVLADGLSNMQTHPTPGAQGAADTINVLPRADDAGSSRQLLEGLTCLQQQAHLLLSAVQHLMQQKTSLQNSTQEVAGIAAKLLHTEESLASNYTCLVCMRTFEQARNCCALRPQLLQELLGCVWYMQGVPQQQQHRGCRRPSCLCASSCLGTALYKVRVPANNIERVAACCGTAARHSSLAVTSQIGQLRMLSLLSDILHAAIHN